MPGRAERLSCRSSVLPWFVVPDDGVENGEQLAHGGNYGRLLGLAGFDQSVSEGLQRRIVTAGHQSSHEQRRAHHRPTAADEASAAPLARLARPWRKAGKRGDL